MDAHLAHVSLRGPSLDLAIFMGVTHPSLPFPTPVKNSLATFSYHFLCLLFLKLLPSHSVSNSEQ